MELENVIWDDFILLICIGSSFIKLRIFLSNSHSKTENLADMSGLKELEESYLQSVKITTHHQWCVMKVSSETNELEIKYMWFQKNKVHDNLSHILSIMPEALIGLFLCSWAVCV